MKTITIKVPDTVDIICANYISTSLFNTWVLNSAIKPKDGMTVIVTAPKNQDDNPAVTYEYKEEA